MFTATTQRSNTVQPVGSLGPFDPDPVECSSPHHGPDYDHNSIKGRLSQDGTSDIFGQTVDSHEGPYVLHSVFYTHQPLPFAVVHG